ncbi:MAG: hypothetical protein RL217_1547 [Pseudomonadota bacterium]|jgi:hydroxyacylglutathione hydrolase
MQVIRLYMHNALRNFNYLLYCQESRLAIALDPFDADVLLQKAGEYQLDIRLIINTHEHSDHTQGNFALQQATGAQVLAHPNALVPAKTANLKAQDCIALGSMRLRVLPSPGHTQAHLCLLAQGDEPMLFSGDTLFNASAGNCKNGGNVDDLFDTFVREIAPLPDSTLLYPGHDYMKNNLVFALDRDPHNVLARYWQEQVAAIPAEDMPVMTLGQERSYNPFLRLNQAEIYAKLQQEMPDLACDERAIFKALRRLRDHW